MYYLLVSIFIDIYCLGFLWKFSTLSYNLYNLECIALVCRNDGESLCHMSWPLGAMLEPTQHVLVWKILLQKFLKYFSQVNYFSNIFKVYFSPKPSCWKDNLPVCHLWKIAWQVTKYLNFYSNVWKSILGRLL